MERHLHSQVLRWNWQLIHSPAEAERANLDNPIPLDVWDLGFVAFFFSLSLCPSFLKERTKSKISGIFSDTKIEDIKRINQIEDSSFGHFGPMPFK